MNIERLQLMSDMLGEVIAGTWKMTTSNEPYRMRVGMPVTSVGFELSSWFGLTPDYCGYCACAVGHACFDDRFNKQGLEFGHDGPEYVVGDNWYSTWLAVEEFFGIDGETAQYLFAHATYFDPAIAHKVEWSRDGSKPPVSPAQVKERVDQLIEKGVV